MNTNLPIPKCPKCNNSNFALVLIEPKGTRFKMYAVCCSECGAVVGTEPFDTTAELIYCLAKKLKVNLD